MDTKYDVKEIDIDEEGNEVFFKKIAGTWKCDFYGPLCYDFFGKVYEKQFAHLTLSSCMLNEPSLIKKVGIS